LRMVIGFVPFKFGFVSHIDSKHFAVALYSNLFSGISSDLPPKGIPLVKLELPVF
jgi:hypothetical protein